MYLLVGTFSIFPRCCGVYMIIFAIVNNLEQIGVELGDARVISILNLGYPAVVTDLREIDSLDLT